MYANIKKSFQISGVSWMNAECDKNKTKEKEKEKKPLTVLKYMKQLH